MLPLLREATATNDSTSNSVPFSVLANHRPRLRPHTSTALSRHVKLQGHRSPYDGDWIYWSARRGRSPNVEPRVARLLRKQAGRCIHCRLYFREGDQLEIAYVNTHATRAKEAYYNLMLLHHDCRDGWSVSLGQ